MQAALKVKPPRPGPACAGLWRRIGAFAIDLGLAATVWLGLCVLLAILLGPWVGAPGGSVLAVGAVVLWQAVSWLYWAVMESSATQGTPGKVLLNMAVTGVDGRRLSLRQATVRHFSKIVSTLAALLGFAMIATTARKQGLHDLVGRSVVVIGRQALPPAGRRRSITTMPGDASRT